MADAALPSSDARFSFAYSTVPSPDHPNRNEDALFVDEKNRSFGIFDGVGGSIDGDKASRLASEALHRDLMHAEMSDVISAETIIRKYINASSRTIRMKHPGALSTCVVGKIIPFDDIYQLTAGSVGDSRLYLFRNGILTLITKDDDAVSPDLSQILDDVTEPSQLDARGQQAFGLRNIITQALGQTDPLRIHHYAFPLRAGDTCILTTDGVHDNLTQREITAIATSDPDIAGAIVEAARRRSLEKHFRSKRDDITAIVINSL